MMDVVVGHSWSYAVSSWPPTNQHPSFYRPDAIPVAKSTESRAGSGDV